MKLFIITRSAYQTFHISPQIFIEGRGRTTEVRHARRCRTISANFLVINEPGAPIVFLFFASLPSTVMQMAKFIETRARAQRVTTFCLVLRPSMNKDGRSTRRIIRFTFANKQVFRWIFFCFFFFSFFAYVYVCVFFYKQIRESV